MYCRLFPENTTKRVFAGLDNMRSFMLPLNHLMSRTTLKESVWLRILVVTVYVVCAALVLFGLSVYM